MMVVITWYPLRVPGSLKEESSMDIGEMVVHVTVNPCQ